MKIRPCKITLIDLHHTAGNEKNTQAVRQEHLNQGWGDIGYNAVVEKNGTVGIGRDIKYSGAHDPGKAPDGSGYTMNQRAFAISHIGNFMIEKMSDIQFNASVKYCVQKCKDFGIIPSKSTIRRHKDQHATSCPGDNFPYDKYVNEVIKLYNGGTNKVSEKIGADRVTPTGSNITPLNGGGWIESLPDRLIIHYNEYRYITIGTNGCVAYTPEGSKKFI